MTMTAAPAGDLPVMVRAQSRCGSKQTVNNNLTMRRAGLSSSNNLMLSFNIGKLFSGQWVSKHWEIHF